MEKANRITQGKIFPALIEFALPVLFALLLQTMYGAVDLMVVGQFGEAQDVSAVSTGSQLMMTVTHVIASLSMGLTVCVGKRIGAQDGKTAGELIGSGIWLFGGLTLLLTAVFVPLSSPLASLLKAPQEAHEKTALYLAICLSGSVFIVFYNLIGSIFRGLGDSKLPLLTVAIACGVNIAGDFLLVGILRTGAAGAAAATVFSQAVSVLISYLIIRRKTLPFLFSKDSLRPRKEHIGAILRLGIPISLQELLVNISFLFILAIVNSLGLTASAGVGVAEKLCGFVMLVPSSFMQSMSAFVAQNIGAQRPDRARKALFYGIASSLAVGIVMAYLNFFHGDLLSGIFAKDPEIIAAASQYLKAYAVDCLLTAFLFCFIGYFNGIGRTVFVMLQGSLAAFCVRLPVSYLMSLQKPASLFRIGLATPAASFFQIIACFVFYFIISRRRQSGTGAKETEPGGENV